MRNRPEYTTFINIAQVSGQPWRATIERAGLRYIVAQWVGDTRLGYTHTVRNRRVALHLLSDMGFVPDEGGN